MVAENFENSKSPRTPEQINTDLWELFDDVRSDISGAKASSESWIDAVDRSLRHIPKMKTLLASPTIEAELRRECERVVEIFQKSREEIYAYFLNGGEL